GPSIPCQDLGQTMHCHAHLMLLFFKPWRSVTDLKRAEENWIIAYKKFYLICSSKIKNRVDNMQVLHECKDSRDD
ncbi:hypothetical protein BDQ17DRAFT_1177307, partial [Cyathus striatus]